MPARWLPGTGVENPEPEGYRKNKQQKTVGSVARNGTWCRLDLISGAKVGSGRAKVAVNVSSGKKSAMQHFLHIPSIFVN